MRAPRRAVPPFASVLRVSHPSLDSRTPRRGTARELPPAVAPRAASHHPSSHVVSLSPLGMRRLPSPGCAARRSTCASAWQFFGKKHTWKEPRVRPNKPGPAVMWSRIPSHRAPRTCVRPRHNSTYGGEREMTAAHGNGLLNRVRVAASAFVTSVQEHAPALSFLVVPGKSLT